LLTLVTSHQGGAACSGSAGPAPQPKQLAVGSGELLTQETNLVEPAATLRAELAGETADDSAVLDLPCRFTGARLVLLAAQLLHAGA